MHVRYRWKACSLYYNPVRFQQSAIMQSAENCRCIMLCIECRQTRAYTASGHERVNHARGVVIDATQTFCCVGHPFPESLMSEYSSTSIMYLGTIFAYGQTSSGKTHTMMGSPREPGVIQLALDEIFSIIAEVGHYLQSCRLRCLVIRLSC